MENELENQEKPVSSPGRRKRRQASSSGFKALESLEPKQVEEVVEPEPTPEPEPAPVLPEPEPEPEPTPEPAPEPEPAPAPVPAPTPTPAPPAKPRRLRKPLRKNKGVNTNGLRIRY